MRMLLMFIYLLLNTISSTAKYPYEITLPVDTNVDSYYSASYSSNIKFNIGDYVGIWYDPSGRNCDFKLNKDLSFEMEWRKDICEIADKTNNTVLLKCNGYFNRFDKKTSDYYVYLKIFYFPEKIDDRQFKLVKHLNVVVDVDKDCVMSSPNNEVDLCDNVLKAPMWVHNMLILKNTGEDFSSCGFFDN